MVKEVESKMKETIIRAKLSQGGTNLVEQLERKVIKMKEELEVERKQAGVKLQTQATRNFKDLEEGQNKVLLSLGLKFNTKIQVLTPTHTPPTHHHKLFNMKEDMQETC